MFFSLVSFDRYRWLFAAAFVGAGIIFGAIESARPGALDMLRAAERANTPLLREHDVRKELA